MMWFNQAQIYRYTHENLDILEEALLSHPLKPCPPHARFIYGWSPVVTEQLTHTVAGVTQFCLGKEERLLPRYVIQRFLTERIQALENERGYAVKRAERQHMAEELEFELLPKAFCIQKHLPALIDHQHAYLILNTSSPSQAEQLIAQLYQSLPDFKIEPFLPNMNPTTVFTHWMQAKESLPQAFTLSSNCALIDLNDDKKRFQCKGFDNPEDEVLSLLSQGLAVSEISLIWRERIEFTLTQQLTFKRVRCLDYLVDEFHDIHQLDETQQLDASLTLLIGEWRALLNDIAKAFAPIPSTTPQHIHNTSESPYLELEK